MKCAETGENCIVRSSTICAALDVTTEIKPRKK
jgi:hypothetical protein